MESHRGRSEVVLWPLLRYHIHPTYPATNNNNSNKQERESSQQSSRKRAKLDRANKEGAECPLCLSQGLSHPGFCHRESFDLPQRACSLTLFLAVSPLLASCAFNTLGFRCFQNPPAVDGTEHLVVSLEAFQVRSLEVHGKRRGLGVPPRIQVRSWRREMSKRPEWQVLCNEACLSQAKVKTTSESDPSYEEFVF